MNSLNHYTRRRGATLAGVFSLALSCALLLCGAGTVPVENFSPQGAMQNDLNAGGHNLTNAGTISATNLVVSGSLTAPMSFTLPFSSIASTPTNLAGYGITDPVVLTNGAYANPSWVTSLAYSKLTGTPTLGTLAALSPTGTADSSHYLRGDDTWATVPSGYTLPVATSSVLGGVKQGANVSIAGDGTLSVAAPVTSLPFSSITSTPTTLAGYGITDPVVLTNGAYANPPWLTSLAYSKLTGTPTLGTLAALSPTGTADSSHYLRGDDTWATLSSSYTLPAATSSTLGGVIVPTSGGLAVDGAGNLSIPAGTGFRTAMTNAVNTPGGMPVADANGNLPNLVAAHAYIMANFATGGTAGTERGQIFLSFDGKTWTQVRGLDNYAPTTGGCRDIGLIKNNTSNLWFVTYTDYATGGICQAYFGVASSPDLVNWTHVADVTPTGNTDPIANPKWFTDTNGNRYVTYYDQTSGKCYAIQNTSNDGATWGSPTDITPTGATAFDPWVRKDGSTYSLYLKPGGYSSGYHRYTSTTLLANGANWTDQGAITPWGTAENVTIFIGSDGKYWAEMNTQGTGYVWAYSTSSDQVTWSATTNITQPSIVAQGTTGTFWDGGTILPITDSNTIINLLFAHVNQTTPNLGITYGSEAVGNTYQGLPTIKGPVTFTGDVAGKTSKIAQLVLTGATTTGDHIDVGYDTTNDEPFIEGGDSSTWQPLCIQPNGGQVLIGITSTDANVPLTVAGSSYSEFRYDGTYQLKLMGKTTTAKCLLVGFDTSNNMGYVDAEWSGNTSEPLSLNANAQPVLVGTETKTGSAELQVTGDTASFGNVESDTLGKGFQVKEGTNAKQGTATLVAGTATVSTTAVTANSRIFLTEQTGGGTPGTPYVSARTAGTSFTITSTSGSDTNSIAYEIFEPAP